MTITAIVPLKALSTAKGRLSAALDSEDRRTVVAWMATHVLQTCLASRLVDEVLLVAGDDAGAALGRKAGVSVLQVNEPGLQRAMDAADGHLVSADVTVTIAADLPDVTATEIDEVLRQALTGPDAAVVIAPTRDGGTGALVRRPGGVIRTAYGPDSAQRHAELATAAGVRCLLVQSPGLAADVDTPVQLTAALARTAGGDVGSPPH